MLRERGDVTIRSFEMVSKDFLEYTDAQEVEQRLRSER